MCRNHEIRLGRGAGLAIAVFFALAPSQDVSQWKGKIETKDGIPRFQNPERPLTGDKAGGIREVLRINGPSKDSPAFKAPSSLYVDNAENIFVLDSPSGHVLKYDKEGKFLLKIGRKGRRPGEIENPRSFSLDPQDRIYISEGRRIQVFDPSGTYLRGLAMEYDIQKFLVARDGQIIAVAQIPAEDEGSEQGIVRFDPNGKKIGIYARFSAPRAMQKPGTNGKILSLTVFHAYNNILYLSGLKEDEFVYGFSSAYRYSVQNIDGKILRIVEKKAPFIAIPQEEKDAIVKDVEKRINKRGRSFSKEMIEAALQFPAYRPFFSFLLTDDYGNIYLAESASVLAEGTDCHLDVFSREGYYLSRWLLPFRPKFIKKDCLYDIFISKKTPKISIIKYQIIGSGNK